MKHAQCRRQNLSNPKEPFQTNVDGINVVSLQGSWHDMGQQYGRLVKEHLKSVLDYADERLGGDGERMASALEIAERMYVQGKEYVREFMRGAAETSGIGLERLKLCNAVEYVEGCFLCSAMAAWDGYTGGPMVFGRNYDAVSYREIDRDVLVTVYHPDDGLAMATVGYAGEIYCVNGMNEKGIFVELNNGMPSAGWDIHWDMCPATSELFDMLLHAQSLDYADRFFHETRSSASFIIGVADGSEARFYEWCHDGMKCDTGAQKGLIVRTNHYTCPLWPYATPSDKDSWNSVTRLSNMTAQAERHKGQIDVPMMKSIMSATIANGGPCHDLTRYRIVAVPGELTLHIFLPYLDRWVELHLFQ